MSSDARHAKLAKKERAGWQSWAQAQVQERRQSPIATAPVSNLLEAPPESQLMQGLLQILSSNEAIALSIQRGMDMVRGSSRRAQAAQQQQLGFIEEGEQEDMQEGTHKPEDRSC
ncbi:hypothetical protein MMC34_003917 [Xylographa carneopallida]|nr:hypothetical protein [Xylographa carneopallida]